MSDELENEPATSNKTKIMASSKLIIWDWNGTLLNDIDACIDSMNFLLEKKKMPLVDRAFYKNNFTFPVIDYYKKLGFDFTKDSFKQLSVEFIDLYHQNSRNSTLQPGAIEILNYFQSEKIRQIVLSAMEQSSLNRQIKQRIPKNYFEHIIGLDNIHAFSKVDQAKFFLENNWKGTAKDMVLIGDTYHDYEVAQAIGCKCVLIENGHQNLKRFVWNGEVKCFSNLTELEKRIFF